MQSNACVDMGIWSATITGKENEKVLNMICERKKAKYNLIGKEIFIKDHIHLYMLFTRFDRDKLVLRFKPSFLKLLTF